MLFCLTVWPQYTACGTIRQVLQERSLVILNLREIKRPNLPFYHVLCVAALYFRSHGICCIWSRLTFEYMPCGFAFVALFSFSPPLPQRMPMCRPLCRCVREIIYTVLNSNDANTLIPVPSGEFLLINTWAYPTPIWCAWLPWRMRLELLSGEHADLRLGSFAQWCRSSRC